MFKFLQKDFPGVKLILKRGCTEMEQRYSPSDEWEELSERGQWDFYEELLNTLFVLEDVPFGVTHEMFHPRIKSKWIEWAFEHGDETYLEYVDKPFKEKYLTYQSSIHNEKDFVGSNFEPIKLKGIGDYGDDHNRSGERSVGTETQDVGSGSEEQAPTLIQRISSRH